MAAKASATSIVVRIPTAGSEARDATTATVTPTSIKVSSAIERDADTATDEF